MWIKIEGKRWLNMNNFIDISGRSKQLFLQGIQLDMRIKFEMDSPEAKAILKWLEGQENKPVSLSTCDDTDWIKHGREKL